MSKLDDLILELCPDGVEYKTLGELGRFYGGLTGKSKKDFENGNETLITYKNVYLNPAVDVNPKDKVKIFEGERQRTLKYGDVIFTGSSEILEESGYSAVVTQKVNKNLYLNSFCFFFRYDDPEIMLPNFTKHLFRSGEIRNQIIGMANGVTRFNLSKEKMKGIRIPIPPLDIQETISKLLDKMMEATDALIDALLNEVGKKKNQRDYYFEKLMSIAQKEYELGDAISFQNGFAFKSARFRNVGKPIVRISNIREGSINLDKVVYFAEEEYNENLEKYKIYPGDIVIAMSGATTGKIAINDSKKVLYLNQRVGKIQAKEDVVDKEYLYYLLKYHSSEIMDISTGNGAQPNLSSEKLKKIKIRIPDMITQKKIAGQLEFFEKQTNRYLKSMDQEVDARKKQFAYYQTALMKLREKPLSKFEIV